MNLQINKNSAFDVPYVGSIKYSNEGQSPNRQLIIRFDRVDYWNFRYHPRASGVSYDVVLSENGSLEVRYYRVDPNPGVYMTVGLRNDDVSTTAYTAVHNRVSLTPAIAGQLTGSTIRYQYTGKSAGEACGAFGYSLLGATGVDIQWTDSSSNLTYYHRVCGVVESPVCQSAPVTEHSTLCEARDNIALYSATSFNPSAIVWRRIDGGIESYEQTGTFCPTPLNAPRVANIKYICSPQASTPTLSNVTVIQRCTYNATVLTSAVCQLATSSSTGVPIRSSSTGTTSTGQSFGSSSLARSSSASSAVSQSSSVFASSSLAQSSSTSSQSSSALFQSSSASYQSSSQQIASSSTSSAGVIVDDGSSSSSNSISDGAIAGAVIGSVAGVLLLCFLLVCLFKKRGGHGFGAEKHSPMEESVSNANHQYDVSMHGSPTLHGSTHQQDASMQEVELSRV